MDGRKLRSPIILYDENGKINPINQIGKMGDFEEFVSKFTPGALQGDKIVTRVGGYDLYADSDCTIYIDKRNANIVVYSTDDISKDITPVNEREYLLLCVGVEDSDFEDTFRGIIGRQNVFETVLDLLDVIDLHKSKILAETTQLNEAITIYQFMKMCVDKQLVENPYRFDPDDFADTLIITEDF